MWRSLILPIAVFALVVISLGSSGGSPTSNISSAASGRASISVCGPEQSHLVPFAANSILIRLVKNNSIVDQATLLQPACESGEPTVSHSTHRRAKFI